MESIFTKSPDSLKSDHLKNGVRPIIACMGKRDSDIIDDIGFLRDKDESKGNFQNIDYYEKLEDIDKKNFLGGGEQTWIISTVDGLNKYSSQFFDCTGIVVVGKDKKDGKNISFLTHQDPTKFLVIRKKIFLDHLTKRLNEIKDRCEVGTIDASIVGGKYPLNSNMGQIYNLGQVRQEYIKSIDVLSLEVEKIFSFEPVVINGPKTGGSYDSVYFDTENRRLYFMRPDTNSKTNGFTNSNIKDEEQKWRKRNL